MEQWVQFLWSVSLKASFVLLIAAALTVALRRASAAARHAIWAAALLSVLALPALTLLLPALPAPAPRVEPAEVVMQPSATVPAGSGIQRTPEWPAWALALWAAGSCAVLARLAAGVVQIALIAHRAVRLKVDIAFPGTEVEVRESERVAVPLAWGILHPVVLLPAGASRWPAERLRAVLRHEYAHVERRDCLLQILSQVACAFYWFHPLAWLAAARMRQEREQACDDRVLAVGTHAPEYASHLLELARVFAASRQRSLAAVAMARPSGLRERLAGILDPNRDRRAMTRRGAVWAGVAALAVLLPLAAHTAQQSSGAGLSGIVSDPSGARVPGAFVLVTFPGSNRKEVATAGPAGEYRLIGLPEGPCNVEVSSPGFTKFVRRDFQLKADTAARLDVTLDLGRVQETVDVVAKRTTPVPSGPPQRIRVGGNVQATRLLYDVKPEYPETAKNRGVEGTVLLQAVISKEGGLLSITPQNSGVDPELTKAAMDAVRQWRYQPTLLNGQPVEVVTTITVNFRLQ